MGKQGIMVSPSLLAADFWRLGELVEAAKDGGADWLHIDVMDGHFVPNISFGLPVIQKIRKHTDLFLDVHLMIENPIDWVERFAEAGADALTVHAENAEPPCIRKIRQLGKKAGISLKPKTPLSSVLPYIDEVDLVLVMSVEPGFGGQRFMPETLQRIRELRSMLEDRPVRISVDGGIDVRTAKEVVLAGADVLVAGTAVFGASDIAGAISALKGRVDA